MSGELAVLLAGVPLLAAGIGLLPMPVLVRELVTVASAVVCAGIAFALVGLDALPVRSLGDNLYLDGLSLVLLVTVSVVYLLSSIYAVGYFAYERDHRDYRVYNRRFHVLFNAFAASIFWVPLTGNVMLMWVAVELTTVTSALLVGLESSKEAAEAAWKYILVASSGLVLALLGLTLLYFIGTAVLGDRYDPTFPAFLGVASRMAPGATLAAFALIVVGFGTKAGLVPMHTWLPDAHSEGATPVSAMLSGALLGVAMYAILRLEPIAVRSAGAAVPHAILFAFGGASLVVAGLFAIRQVNLKRLYAYSSIEHMGIVAVGAAFGSPLALYGVMLHLVAHGASKALAFFGAGSVTQRFQTRDSRSVHGLATLMPATAAFLLAGLFFVSAVPPAALFRSEITILLGGFQQRAFLPAALLILFANLVFLGGLRLVNQMSFSHPLKSEVRGESSPVMVAAMFLAAIPAVALAFYIPAQLDHVFAEAARAVLGGS